jgi:hypothetical protein
MTPRLRSNLIFLPLGIQLLAAITAVGALGFVNTALSGFVAEYRGELILPAPSRLFLDHPAVVQGIVLGLFVLSCLGCYWSRKKVKDEADQLVIQGVIQSVVWCLAVIYVSGAIMAGLLPFFSLKR